MSALLNLNALITENIQRNLTVLKCLKIWFLRDETAFKTQLSAHLTKNLDGGVFEMAIDGTTGVKLESAGPLVGFDDSGSHSFICDSSGFYGFSKFGLPIQVKFSEDSWPQKDSNVFGELSVFETCAQKMKEFLRFIDYPSLLNLRRTNRLLKTLVDQYDFKPEIVEILSTCKTLPTFKLADEAFGHLEREIGLPSILMVKHLFPFLFYSGKNTLGYKWPFIYNSPFSARPYSKTTVLALFTYYIHIHSGFINSFVTHKWDSSEVLNFHPFGDSDMIVTCSNYANLKATIYRQREKGGHKSYRVTIVSRISGTRITVETHTGFEIFNVRYYNIFVFLNNEKFRRTFSVPPY